MKYKIGFHYHFVDAYILICLFVFIISISFSFGSNQYTPFSLGNHYIIMEYQDAATLSYQSLFQEYRDDITIIAEPADDQTTLGLYDPQMKYYIHSQKSVVPEERRYFSKEDYKNGNNVGIFVSNEDLYDFSMDYVSKMYHTEAINTLGYSELAVDERELVKNLYAMECKQNDVLYIDATNFATIKQMKSYLEEFGFHAIEREDTMSIFDTIQQSLTSRHSQFLLIISGGLCLLLILVLYSYVYGKSREIELGNLYGGARDVIFYQVFKHLFMNFIVHYLMVMVLIWYLKSVGYYFISLNHLVQLLFIYTIFVVCCTYGIYRFHYRHLKSGKDV